MLPTYPLWDGVIPLDGTTSGVSGATIVEPVITPDWKNTDAELLQTVAAVGEAVYGLFPKVDGTLHWNILTNVPHQPPLDPAGNELAYGGTAVASLDGHRVFVGTNNGKLFRLDEPGWNATAISPPGAPRPITRIAVITPDDILIIAGPSIWRWNAAVWTQLPAATPPLPAAPRALVSIAVDRTAAPARLFVATDISVWQSNDNAATWFESNIGLPTVANCADLRSVIESSGAGFLYLGTWGWSVFRLLTNAEDVTQTVTIDGHMDIVDRQAIGKDIWGHPSFLRLTTVGSLHPFADLSVTGDNGDEVRVEIALKCAWKLDGSVTVSFDAVLLDLGEGEITDQTGGSRVVPFGATETVAFDMASDESWPDRAHVEFTINNV